MTTPIPGQRTRELAQTLRQYESRNVTFLGQTFPVFWETSYGATITDVDGNRFTDLTSAFGVANTGHSNPHVAAAIGEQAARLMHAMGDVHPTQAKAELLQLLAQIAPGDLERTFLASTGAEAVEAAMKTAMIATGKTAFAAFRNAYHGLSLGTLAIGGIEKFKAPFASVLPKSTLLLDFPDAAHVTAQDALQAARGALTARTGIAAVFVEPIQGRAGCIVPPEGFLSGLRAICDDLGLLLVFDEIYTGFGRTGTLFACMHENVVPDILCIGKAMANGFPISATVARAGVMDAWPVSTGEALHTSTYLGSPMGCAAALANIKELQRHQLPLRAQHLGAELGPRLENLRSKDSVRAVRGRGLMWAIELPDGARAERLVHDALSAGLILLQAGPTGACISITPPLVIAHDELFRAIDIIEELL